MYPDDPTKLTSKVPVAKDAGSELVSNGSSYQPPSNPLQVMQQLAIDEGLKPDDPRNVDTHAARGSQLTFERLAKKVGLDPKRGDFYPASRSHVLIFGHTGSGKTTEIRKAGNWLSKFAHHYVVEVDVLRELDRNNLSYPDVLLALAKQLLAKLGEEKVAVDAKGLQPLSSWFDEHVINHEADLAMGMELEAGVKVGTEIPFLAGLFGKFTSSIKSNSTHKDTLRTVVRNSFTVFAEAFNTLVQDAEKALSQSGKSKRILFIVDGTDKLNGEDTKAFFRDNTEQLLAIRALVWYTAPIQMKFEGWFDRGKLDADLVLPMIKLVTPKGEKLEAGYAAMRSILLLRADESLFASEEVIKLLIDSSGGHPRELLRLLKISCELAEDVPIQPSVVQSACDQLASEYRRFLTAQDYQYLARIDYGVDHVCSDERMNDLLFNLALLEYNDGSWRRSNPVIRRLPAYKDEAKKLPQA